MESMHIEEIRVQANIDGRKSLILTGFSNNGDEMAVSIPLLKANPGMMSNIDVLSSVTFAVKTEEPVEVKAPVKRSHKKNLAKVAVK